jgi:hypothetical protein
MTLIVTGNPLIALFTTLRILAPLPKCSLAFVNANAPYFLPTSSPSPYTGQNGNGDPGFCSSVAFR